MWMFTKYGFFSITGAPTGKNHAGKPDGAKVQVRARKEDHLQELIDRFPDRLKGVKIVRTPLADYKWRIVVPFDAWLGVAAELAGEAAEYNNFKKECTRFADGWDQPYIDALHAVWGRMFRLEDSGQQQGA